MTNQLQEQAMTPDDYNTPERLDAATDKMVAAATQDIVGDFQRGNGCADLKPYSRTAMIDDRGGDDDAMSSTIELTERYSRDMMSPSAVVRANVSVVWPVEGGEGDRHNMPTTFVASFAALPATRDGGRSIEQATHDAKRWADSTLTAIDQARHAHAFSLGLDDELDTP